MRVLWGVLLFSGAAIAAPMTNQEAADAGKSLGQQQDALITPQINQTNADTSIPHITGTPPETQFFGGGRANNFLPGDNKRIACDTGAPSSDKWVQQSCDAVNLVAKAPNQRPLFNIARTDPILAREQSVRANAAVVAFSTSGGGGAASNPNGFGITGTYSGCTTTTTPDPGTTTTKTCVDYMAATEAPATSTCQLSSNTPQTCTKDLSVTVNQPAPIPATPVSSCGVGYTLSGSTCTAPATAADPSYSCSTGILSGTECIQPAYQPPGVAATGTIQTSPTYNYANAAGPSVIPSLCIAGGYSGGTLVNILTYPGQIDNLFRFTYFCQRTIYSCPSGYTLSGTTCYPPMTTPPPTAATVSYSCATGTLSGTSCIQPDIPADVTYTCGVGMTLSGTTCIPAPTFTKAWTDNCTNLQAKTI